MNRFRMPHGDGDTELKTNLNGFADAIDELGLLVALAEHNLIVTTAGLRQMATDLLAGARAQRLALRKQAGATAAIPDGAEHGARMQEDFRCDLQQYLRREYRDADNVALGEPCGA